MSSAFKRVVPLFDRILVERALAPKQTKYGIMLPEKSTPEMMEGQVVAVGPGARNPENGDFIPPVVRCGDRILLPSYGGTKIKLDDKKEYLVYNETDILAKLE